ncbi:MAG: hypothetical protein K6C69_02035, partial [Lachnospiraceae bacterium]|nr:hypothetical protein [Lachnospiraceae bacterium]
MMNLIKALKTYWLSVLCTICLLTYTTYVLLDTFILPHAYYVVSTGSSSTASTGTTTATTNNAGTT